MMAEAGQSGPGIPGGRATPRVFTRLITTPPGPPWRQARMAELEARQSAPLPLSDIAYRIRRLGFWDGGQARYAAFYVRSADFTESFVAEAQIDGETLRMRMAHPAEARRRRGRTATLGLTSAVLIVIVGASLSTASAQREHMSNQLDQAERQATSRFRQAQAIHRRFREASLLASASRQDVGVEAVLADLNWVAATKSPDARIQAFHWQDGVFAVESLGPTPPVESYERPLVRSAKPIRAGVWAWAAPKPAPIKAAAPGPVTSELR